jgi:5-methyltetrahydrofolate--homocysteine methyltransferase
LGSEHIEALADSIINFKMEDGGVYTAPKLTKEALDAGTDPQEVLHQGLIAGMNVVGEKFSAQEYFLPEVLCAAKAMQGALEILKPVLAETGAKPVGTVVIGTVQGDLHDIGKNLVSMMLQGAGFEVIDLGVDVDPKKFAEEAEKNGAQVIGLSALLTTTMVKMPDVIEALKGSGIREKVKVMIGGAPVTQSYADEVGADGYAADSTGAVALARSFVGAASS